MKTYEDWKGSLCEYLQVGDQVDEGIYNHFVNALPPATFWSTLVQMGEPYSHVNGKATFATLAKENGVWTYKGHCHRGETEEPVYA